jgi:hypothetical protein
VDNIADVMHNDDGHKPCEQETKAGHRRCVLWVRTRGHIGLPAKILAMSPELSRVEMIKVSGTLNTLKLILIRFSYATIKIALTEKN